MKRFSRCLNCHQWYVHNAVQLVETIQGNGLQQTALWCENCIRAAEERSSLAPEAGPDQATDRPLLATPVTSLTRPNDDLPQILQEHLDLMEHALQEDDDTIIPLVEDFVQRCAATQIALEEPTLVKRLAGHMKYWETFLTTIKQSRQ